MTAFVTKLSPDGSSLVYSTYLGGTGATGGSRSGGIAVDAAGSAYVFGAASPDFPVTPGAFQTTDQHITAFRSGNSGALWMAGGAGLPNDTILTLAVDPANPNIVYAGTYNNNVYKTTDGGMTWLGSSSGLPTKIYDPTSLLIVSAIYALAIDPVTPTTLYATTGKGPYKSLDGGATWNPSNLGLTLPLQALVIDPKTPTTLYAAPKSALFMDNPGTANGGTPLYKSLDGGTTWNPSSAGLPIYVQVLAVDPTNPIIAAYGGSSNFNSSNSQPVTVIVTATGTTLFPTNQVLTSSANSSTFGQSVTFTLTVTPAAGQTGTPTGTVTFTDGATLLGTPGLTNGAASFTTSTLSVGSHNITAMYSGDARFSGITLNSLGQVVNAATTGSLFTFPAGISMITVPFDFSVSLADAASYLNLPILTGPTGSTVIPIATYEPLSNQYLLYPNLPGGDGTQTQPGRGYWIEELTPQSFVTPPGGTAVSSPFRITLAKGWNQVGSPFLSSLPVSSLQFSVPVTVNGIAANTLMTLQQAMAANVVRSGFYGYDPGTNRYFQSTTLGAFAGYWVYVDPLTPGGLVTVQYTTPNAK